MKLVIFILLACAALRAAPIAKAYTESSVANAGVPPCWATSAVTPNPLIGAAWDTSGHFANHLNASASTGTSLTYLWTQLSGPTVTITSTTSAVTTVTDPMGGPVTAGYRTFNVHVVDSMAASADAEIDVGAIAIDVNGAVVQPDPNITKVFNPMIALGHNPWCYQDQEHIAATLLQIANNTYYSSMAAIWSVSGQGTVAYPFSGIGFGQPGASVCGTTSCNGTTVSATALSFSIHNSERITGLTSLPTWIVVGGLGIVGEMMRVTAITAIGGGMWTGSGDATVTIGYDGRGMSSYISYNSNFPGAASTHPNNEVVGEQRIQGTSTLFATDSQRPLCPAGIPGPPGPVAYFAGTIDLTHGSASVTGHGTVWTSTLINGMLWTSGTTHSGTPFNFWRRITAVGSNTGLTLDHAFPSDADDAATITYKITGQFWVSLEFSDTTYGGVHRALQNFQGCESETAGFSTATYDNPFNADNETLMHYSYKLSVGAQSQPVGPNFYGTDLAELSFYYRSGYTPALTASRLISDYFIRDPEMCGSYCAASPFQTGGGWIGGAANTWLNGSALTSVTDLRPWAASAAASLINSYNVCNTGLDTRDQGYLASFLVLTSMIDVGGSFGSTWLADLGSAGGGPGVMGAGVLGRDQLCKQSDNSFAQGIVPAPVMADAALTLMHGDPIAHGTALPSNICAGVASGNITVTHGSFAASSSDPLGNPATNAAILIYDTTSSPHYVGYFTFSFSGTDVILAAAWPGASGTFSYVIEDDSQLGRDNAVGINAIYLNGSDADDVRMIENWACTWDSSTQITLNRPWDDDVNGVPGSHTNGTYYLYASALHAVVVGGYFQQPYEFGIKSKIVNWAANNVPNATINSGYSTILGGMGQWFHDVGYDPYTNGGYYATVNLACLPQVAPKSPSDPPGTSVFGSINPSCGNSGLEGLDGPEMGEYPSRIYTVEGFDAIYAYYRSQCLLGVSQCNAARAFGDKGYGAIWGPPSITKAGYYSDANYVSNINGELNGGSPCPGLGTCKWSGFFFGVGMSHVWPALRCESAAANTPGCPSTDVTGGVFIGGKVTISGNTFRQ